MVLLAVALLGGGVLLGFAGYFWYKKRASLRKNKFRKPFATDSRRPREPLETDLKKRALRLKQRFLPSALPSEIDAIVIGSGAGGLTSAAILAKTGRKVVVLEQHDQAGGCCHTFVEDGYEWDVGIHYVGNVGPTQYGRFLLDQLTEGQLDWNPLDSDTDNVFLVKSPGEITTVPMWGDRQRLLDDLIKRFPNQEKGLRKFFADLKPMDSDFQYYAILKVLPYWMAFLFVKLRIYVFFTKFFDNFYKKTIKQYFNELFGEGNHNLKAILGYCFGDFGVEPSRAGAGMLALIYGHYEPLSYYPVGGSSEIPYTMIPTIEKAGGRVFVNANVTEILISEDTGKAIGVRVDTSSGPVEIKAPIVISDAGVPNTFKRLLPKELAAKTKIGRLLDSGRLKSGRAMFQIFVGIKGSQEELKLPGKNFWLFYDSDIDKAMEGWCRLDLDSAIQDAKIPFLFASFPSAKDPTYNDRFPGRSVCTIITVTPIEWFRKWEREPVKRRSPDYEALKMQLARRCWDLVLADVFPRSQLADRMDHIDAGSPLSAAYYLNAYAGEPYGLDHDTNRYAPDVVLNLRPKVPDVPGLYLTGQDSLNGGFEAAVLSGFLTCQTILQPLGECSSSFIADACQFGDIKPIQEAEQQQQKKDK